MLTIDIYTEITCPWCYIGQYRLDKVLRERLPDIDTNIRHHPVLLLPDAPVTGIFIPDMLRSCYGIQKPQEAFARPEAAARASGLELDLSRQLWAYPTQAAHALIAEAAIHGTQHQLAMSISAAYFTEARNISDIGVLIDIAVAFGFEAQEAHAIASEPQYRRRVEDAAANAAQAGIRSVPHFIFGAHHVLTGAPSEDDLEVAILAAENTEAASVL